MTRNAFEAMCERASREGWTFRLTCGPCCTAFFDAGFRAIKRGLHPDEPNWPIEMGKGAPLDVCRDEETRNPEIDEAVLAAMVGEADLSRVAGVARPKVWLGALQVLLWNHVRSDESVRYLTERLGPQLAELCEEPVRSGLRDELARGKRLTAIGLEEVVASLPTMMSAARQQGSKENGMETGKHEFESDAPVKLCALSDIAKVQAIANAVGLLTGVRVEAQVRSVEYRAFHRLGTFRKPAEIRASLVMADREDAAIEALQTLSDQDLEEAIAISLSKAAGEDYVVRIRSKRYDTIRRRKGEPVTHDLVVQVGRDVGLVH